MFAEVLVCFYYQHWFASHLLNHYLLIHCSQVVLSLFLQPHVSITSTVCCSLHSINLHLFCHHPQVASY